MLIKSAWSINVNDAHDLARCKTVAVTAVCSNVVKQTTAGHRLTNTTASALKFITKSVT